MSFEMEKDEHQIRMTYDILYGLEILDLRCPYKTKLEDIRHHWYEEVPPFTMPFLDCKNESVQKYIKDMTKWGKKLHVLFGGDSQFIEKDDKDV